MIKPGEKTGVILMTYGSATRARNVKKFFEHIYKGKAPQALIKKFEERYKTIGHSPLVEITKKQAYLLEKQLGKSYVVRAGMQHSRPSIEEAVRECKKAHATFLIGIVLSPQFSGAIMNGYKSLFTEAASIHGFVSSRISIAGPWPKEIHFIKYLSQEVKNKLRKLSKRYKEVPIIFSTHSLPERVVKKDRNYLSQLQTTITAIRKELSPKIKWYFGYQSAGHTEEKWLKPDVKNILSQLKTKKVPAVLIVPIQFLSDHLEIIYDLDVAAKEQCEEYGIAYHRIEMPNTHKLFIQALEEVTLRTKKLQQKTAYRNRDRKSHNHKK